MCIILMYVYCNRYTETLTLEDCWVPDEAFNQTFSNLYLGYLTSLRHRFYRIFNIKISLIWNFTAYFL